MLQLAAKVCEEITQCDSFEVHKMPIEFEFADICQLEFQTPPSGSNVLVHLEMSSKANGRH